MTTSTMARSGRSSSTSRSGAQGSRRRIVLWIVALVMYGLAAFVGLKRWLSYREGWR
jgi:hypothetical protein